MFTPRAVLVALLAFPTSFFAGAYSLPRTPQSNVVPNAFIIQVDPLVLSKRDEFVGAPVTVALGNLATANVSFEVRQLFTDAPDDAFHGASINTATGTTATDLLNVPGIQRVWPVRRMKRPSPARTADGAGGGGSGPVTAAQLGGGSSRAKRSVATYANDSFGPHLMTGVNTTHAKGQLGAGQLVCAIDTGVDFNNPILGGCFGPNCHISVGYDLVGDAYNGTNTPVPGPTPYDGCEGHGTHVSGIVGALPNKYGFTGVAPAASLGMFRVFGCLGFTTDDIILQAYIKAMKAGCDVITISIGAPGGWESANALEVTIDSAASQGIFTSVAAGNEQDEGMFFSSEPSANRNGFSVSSIDALNLPSWNATAIGVSVDPVTYLSAVPFNAVPYATTGLRVYFTSTKISTPDDACKPLVGAPNLAKYIVFIQRGTCLFSTKMVNAAAAGAKYVIIYNKPSATQEIYLSVADYPAEGLYGLATMRHADGVKLLNSYLAFPRILLRFAGAVPARGTVDMIGGNTVSYFSSFATTFDMFSETASAPGGTILSTYPLPFGGVAILSGTSMATPFVAGAAAVLKSARASEGLTVAQIKGLLSTTAKLRTVTPDPSSPFASVTLQGSGLIQLDLALAANTFITPTQILLNDTSYLNGTQTLRFTNKNSYSTLYAFSNIVAAGQGLYDAPGENLPSLSPPFVTAAQARVSFSKNRQILRPGETGTVSVTITPPTLSPSDAALFPTYSGWIAIAGTPLGATGAASERYSVPYFGLAASLLNVPIFDQSDTVYGPGAAYPLLADQNSGNVQTGPAVYSTSDPPVIYARFAMGSSLFLIDLVAASTPFVGTIPTGNNAARVKRDSFDRVVRTTTSRARFSDTVTLGNVFSATYLPRDSLVSGGNPPYSDQEITFDGTYTCGPTTKIVANGVSYRLLLRALKITGDAAYEDAYESWLSPPFSFA